MVKPFAFGIKTNKDSQFPIAFVKADARNIKIVTATLKTDKDENSTKAKIYSYEIIGKQKQLILRIGNDLIKGVLG